MLRRRSLVVLLTDLWEQPGRHLDAFRNGGAPTTADVVVDEPPLPPVPPPIGQELTSAPPQG